MKGNYLKFDTGEFHILPFGAREFRLNIVQRHVDKDGLMLLVDIGPGHSVIRLFGGASSDVLAHLGSKRAPANTRLVRESISRQAAKTCCGTTCEAYTYRIWLPSFFIHAL